MSERPCTCKVKVGCCGLAGLTLIKYEKVFELLEVQSTFYRLPEASTAKRWREAVGKDFEFTLKAFQAVTHPTGSPTWRRAGLQRPKPSELVGHLTLNDTTKRAWDRSLAIAKELKARIMVVQLPPSFEYNDHNLANIERFFTHVEVSVIPAVEFRHRSWMGRLDLTGKLLERFGGIVVTDPLKGQSLKQPISYHRLHGMDGFTNYRYMYSDSDLAELKEKLGGQEAYVLFNNLSMRDDAAKFASIITPPKKQRCLKRERPAKMSS